jgi:RNA binding exosome subunit
MNFKEYWICKKESIDLSNLSTDDKMQSIFNHFNTGIEVLASKLDERTFCPIFQIRLNGRISELKVTSETLHDTISSLIDYDQNYLILMEKKSIIEGRLKISCKKLR